MKFNNNGDLSRRRVSLTYIRESFFPRVRARLFRRLARTSFLAPVFLANDASDDRLKHFPGHKSGRFYVKDVVSDMAKERYEIVADRAT